VRRILFTVGLVVSIAVGFAACGGGAVTPTTPTTSSSGGGGGGSSQPPPNTPPVVDGITVQGTRAKEPANFADVGEAIQVTAAVHDAETPVDQLQYQWAATAGTFSGTGATVTWTAPASATTPGTVTLTLTVLENYGQGPAAGQNKVNGTATVSLHDSTKEVGDMARQFLLDFSDSNIKDVSYIMRNFQPGCYGTDPETEQVADNRKKYVIFNWSVGPANVILGFGTIGPYGGQHGDAFAGVPVHWESTRLADNVLENVAGTDWVAAFYYPDQQRWRLCDSRFDGHLAFGSTFIRR